jgi:hypothetical protein
MPPQILTNRNNQLDVISTALKPHADKPEITSKPNTLPKEDHIADWVPYEPPLRKASNTAGPGVATEAIVTKTNNHNESIICMLVSIFLVEFNAFKISIGAL